MKIGDNVRLRSDLVVNDYYGGMKLNSSMVRHCGKIGIVIDVSLSGNVNISIDGGAFNYSPEMLIKLEGDITMGSNIQVGDKLIIRRDLVNHEEYGDQDVNGEMVMLAGEIATVTFVYDDGDFEIDLDNNNNYWTREMFIDEATMKKSDLQNGQVVELRDGNLLLVQLDLVHRKDDEPTDKLISLSDGRFMELYNFGEDMLCKYSHNKYDKYDKYDVLAVYELDYIGDIFRGEIEKSELNLIWERVPAVKLTVKEIEERLGFKVEVID